ncbi:MAG TPA: ribonuclease HII [Anaeromyxobacteraceae bacterium]|nr:ribonuclease HII [Anaeromyxobacteraceae bacterium]
MHPEELAELSVAELRDRLLAREEPLSPACEEALARDRRAGARSVLQALRRRRSRNRAEGQRLRRLLRYETALWERGVALVAGVDEAGMAPLAGPVVAGACILPRDYRPRGVDDSKALAPEERSRLAVDIRQNAVAFGIGRAEVEEIDRLNVYWAGILALRRAVLAMPVRPEHLLIDARRIRDLDIPQDGIVHGDALSLTIAAASILAKTTRDTLMEEMDRAYPGYGFARHKGYPTPDHLAALKERGACPIHRRSFAPVREVLGAGPSQVEMFPEGN